MPATLLFGPRRVGKSALAQRLVAELGASGCYLDAGRPADYDRLRAGASDLWPAGCKLTVIDEVHRVPQALPSLLRRNIDRPLRAGDRGGCFLLLASGPVEVWRREEHWQRRVAQVEMTPLLVGEAAYAGVSLDDLWLRGGYPESVTAVGADRSLRWRQQLIRDCIDRDFRIFAPRLPAETVGRLWIMLAHAQGAPLNRNLLAANLEVSATAVQRYLKLLVDIGLVRRLQPWPGTVGKRLVRSPRIFVRDSGLLHALLDIGDHARLLSHPVVAASWQGFAIEHLIAAAGGRWRPCHYRTQNGAQIDLVFERGGTAELAVAIRRSPTAPLPRGFHAGCEVLRPGGRYLVHGGEETGETPRGVTVIGLLALAEQLSRDATTTVTVTGLRARAERFAQRQVS